MSLLGIIVVVVTGIVLALAALALVGARRMRGMRTEFRGRVAAHGTTELSAQANLFGQASAGKTQVRGLGTLLLTSEELVFVQLLPARELRVPRDAITSCRVTRHFLGKTQGRDLLVVTWDANGMGDAAAFDTPNTSEWVSRLS